MTTKYVIVERPPQTGQVDLLAGEEVACAVGIDAAVKAFRLAQRGSMRPAAIRLLRNNKGRRECPTVADMTSLAAAITGPTTTGSL